MNKGNHQEYKLTNGNDDLILFIHGILGSPCQFRPLANALFRQDYDCQALLLPGHGGDGRAFYRTPCAQWNSYVQQRVCEAVRSYRRVFLVGHSLGGLLSLECAACNRVDGIILINTPMAFKLSARQMAFSMKIVLSSPEKDDDFLSAYREAYSVTQARLSDYPLWMKPFYGLYRQIRQARKSLPDIHVRTLIVQSDRDEAIRRKSAEILRTQLDNACAEVVRLQHSYHGYFPEPDRQLLLESILRFIAI